MVFEREIVKGCEIILDDCGDLKPNEKVLIVSDDTTSAIGELLYSMAVRRARNAIHLVVPLFETHGMEPPREVAESMTGMDLICGLTRMSIAQSEACRDAILTGSRYLSLADYSYDVLLSKALRAEFRSITPTAHYIADAFTMADTITLLTDAGSFLSCGIAGRSGNAAPGWCYAPGVIASPPDCEANIAVIERRSSGRLVVDGSITHPRLGLLVAPIEISIEEGHIIGISGYHAEILESLIAEANDQRAWTIAEFGVGLNPLASLCGKMLEDEGTLGTVHIGIGSNWGIGGANRVPFHLDMVIRGPTVLLDGTTVIKNGLIVSRKILDGT